MDIRELESKKLSELRDIARELEISGFSTAKKQDLVIGIMRAEARKEGHDFRGGVLEIIESDKQSPTPQPNHTLPYYEEFVKHMF